MNKRTYRWLGIAAATAVLTACPSDDDPQTGPATQTFSIEVTNLSANQPLSPIVALVHDSSISAWQTGSAAIEPLEQLAESGDGSALMAIEGLTASMAGAGVIMPGMSDSVEVSFASNDSQHLTLATMLVNTNDAFTGINAWMLSQLELEQSWTTNAMVYDAGTEGNSESAASIPGPAAGGAGFDAARDDVDRVHVHPGVVSSDDGLSSSALDASHKFDNPVMKIVITRIE